jgi:hypothetical protein
MKLRAVAALLLVLGVASSATLTLAQTKPAGRAKPRPAAGRKVGDAGAEPAPAAQKGDAGAGEIIQQKTLDGGAKVFRFGELEIEGRLKNPQLVFFLRRVRAEFAAGDLGHRSFMRELSDTRHDPNF